MVERLRLLSIKKRPLMTRLELLCNFLYDNSNDEVLKYKDILIENFSDELTSLQNSKEFDVFSIDYFNKAYELTLLAKKKRREELLTSLDI